jgi:hypothetical protein
LPNEIHKLLTDYYKDNNEVKKLMRLPETVVASTKYFDKFIHFFNEDEMGIF